MDTIYGVEMKGITKVFGGVRALNNVSLNIKYGEVHALVGQNGAGKSTLMKILSGRYKKDKGEILVGGKPFSANSLIDARKKGIGIVYQELPLVPDVSVAENIFMSKLSRKKGIVDWNYINERAGEEIQKLGFDIDPKERVGNLSVAYQQIVEISKVLSENAKILVLDEPTAVLSPKESEKLFEIVEDLRSKGVGIVYISHRLDEIFRLADRITVLKDGSVVETLHTKETDVSEIVKLMVGQRIEEMFPEKNQSFGEVIFSAKNLTNAPKVNGISFDIKKGEILGVAGLVGAGKTELARLIFGVDRIQEGSIEFKGKTIANKSPAQAVENKIGYLAESRKEHGVLLDRSVRVNTTLAALKEVKGHFNMINAHKEEKLVADLINKLHIKTDGMDVNVSSLSGGNQQKVSFAKWLFGDNELIILDEPTRGVDVGAKVEIYKLIKDLASKGLTFMLISSELEEVVGLSNRVIVLNKGNHTGTLEGDEICLDRVFKLSLGTKEEMEASV